MKNKETLEEAAENWNEKQTTLEFGKPHNAPSRINAFIKGAKWQQERSYSEEEVLKLLISKEENTKEKDLEEITDTSYPQAMEATPLSSADADFIKKLDQIINENLSSEKLSIKYLTDTMAMSRASLYNKVKQITGLGVNEYINRLRIERSVYLLANTNLSISEISYEVGFSYPRYFSTSFKQMKGVTPSQFKEKNKNSGHI